MLADTERLKIEMATLDREIAANDKLIEEAERRQELRRRHGDDLFRRRLRAQAELERAEAPLRKPVGHCVRLNGWDV